VLGDVLAAAVDELLDDVDFVFPGVGFDLVVKYFADVSLDCFRFQLLGNLVKNGSESVVGAVVGIVKSADEVAAVITIVALDDLLGFSLSFCRR